MAPVQEQSKLMDQARPPGGNASVRNLSAACGAEIVVEIPTGMAAGCLQLVARSFHLEGHINDDRLTLHFKHCGVAHFEASQLSP